MSILKTRSTDTFINLNLLYEQSDPIIEELSGTISLIEMWLESSTIKDDIWIPAEVRRILGYIYEKNQKTQESLKNLKLTFDNFKKRKTGNQARLMKGIIVLNM